MAAATQDLIRTARARMLEAAELYRRGTTLLRSVVQELERHPGFVETVEQSRDGVPRHECVSLAWWIHNGLLSTLDDMSLKSAARLLRQDARPDGAESSMREFVKTSRREAAMFARRRKRAAA